MDDSSTKSTDPTKPADVKAKATKPPKTFPQQNKFNVKGSQVRSLPHKMHKTGGRGR